MQPDILYSMTFQNGRREEIAIMLDAENGEILIDDDFIPPAWALLGHQQCSHCPLHADEVTYCPIARNLAYLFSGRNTGTSHDKVFLRVQVGQRG